MAVDIHAAADGKAPIIELDGIEMRFGTNRVLEDVNFRVDSGEVVGLVGDNGAGKSTLVKIITGYHKPVKGTIRFRGQTRTFANPGDARAVGIETVYQDLALADEMSLWRNFFLGKEMVYRIGPLRILKRRTMREICEAALKEIGLTRFRSAEAYAASLSGGERQSLAITRAVHFGAVLLLLDEPTASLSVKETRKVLSSIEAAKGKGLGVVYIDHNVSHVHPVADRIVLLQHGRVAANVPRGTATLEELNELIAAPVSA